MVKIGKFLSIFVVLTLLILLAPVAILAPPENVAQGQVCNNTKQIEATFVFNETETGQWWPFTAGSNHIDPAGLCLEQYTRDNVVRSTTLAGCGFRNYTTGAGTVGPGLNGIMDLAWLSTNFSMKYDKPAQLYHDYGGGAHFGWMMGRGHYYEEGNTSNNFTFVFALDFDSDADITNAVGKGLMLSVEENGIFGPMSNPPEQRHKIIGAFDVTKSGAVYTWNLHLRNYDPSEVYNLGIVTTWGSVVQEATDPIHIGLDILDFKTGGAKPTPHNLTTDFEEVTWGKDPLKTVMGGHLGAGATMDVSRNTILYLEINLGAGWVRIQGTTGNNIYINDTYAVTGDDGSKYGELYELLLLYIPDQTLPIGEFFSQFGYTFTSFDMHNASTGWYEGAENFADAEIAIESTVGTSLQTSIDQVFGLCPHPKCEGTVPNTGSPNTTMNVTISGKYFLRAAGAKSGWVNKSGDVDFGAGINVTSYAINTKNPINNSINVTIAISPAAVPGPRVVNVTSCFNYANGNGSAPYLSGLCNFTVAAAGASLDGHVGLSGFPATNVTVRFFSPNTTTEAMKKYGTTDAGGNFTIGNLTPGTYDVAVKGWTSLSNLVTGVNLSVPGRIDFGVLLEGDARSSNDDYIDFSDYGPLSSAWLSFPLCIPPLFWDPNVDFSRDDYIDFSDYGPLSANWLRWGDTFGWPGNWN